MSGLRPSPWADRSAPGSLSLSKRPHTRAQTRKPNFAEQESAWTHKPVRQWNPADLAGWLSTQSDLGPDVSQLPHMDGAQILELCEAKNSTAVAGVNEDLLTTVVGRLRQLEAPPIRGSILDAMGRGCCGPVKKRKMGSATSPPNTTSLSNSVTSPTTASDNLDGTPEVPTETKVAARTKIARRTWLQLKSEDAKVQAEKRQEECTNLLMMEREQLGTPAIEWLQQHPTLDAGMRAVLVDWMMEVCREFEMQRESFYLSISVLDHFLSAVRQVHQSKLQLVGVASMLIAAKMEEIYPLKVHELALITDGAFSTAELRKMEKCVLEKLDWDVYFISPLQFTVSYLNRIPTERCRKEVLCEIMAYLDLSSLDCKSCCFLPSQLASTALHLVLHPSAHVFDKVTGRTAKELASCIEWMSQFRWLVPNLLHSAGSPGWCCPVSSLYRNVVHPLDVHLVQPYYPDAIQKLKERQHQLHLETLKREQ